MNPTDFIRKHITDALVAEGYLEQVAPVGAGADHQSRTPDKEKTGEGDQPARLFLIKVFIPVGEFIGRNSVKNNINNQQGMASVNAENLPVIAEVTWHTQTDRRIQWRRSIAGTGIRAVLLCMSPDGTGRSSRFISPGRDTRMSACSRSGSFNSILRGAKNEPSTP